MKVLRVYWAVSGGERGKVLGNSGLAWPGGVGLGGVLPVILGYWMVNVAYRDGACRWAGTRLTLSTGHAKLQDVENVNVGMRSRTYLYVYVRIRLYGKAQRASVRLSTQRPAECH